MILSTPPFFFCIFLLNSFNCKVLTHVHPMRTRRLPLDISLKTRFWVSTRMSKTWLLVAGGQARICPRTAMHACASAANSDGKTATLSHKLSCNTSAMFKPRKNERKDAKPSPYYSIIIAQCHVFFFVKPERRSRVSLKGVTGAEAMRSPSHGRHHHDGGDPKNRRTRQPRRDTSVVAGHKLPPDCPSPQT